MPLRRSRWLFVVLFLVSGDALPGKPSVAEGLARKHRDMPGFATSVLNLLAFSFYFWAGGAALQRWVSVQQVPCSFYHFSSRGPLWLACLLHYARRGCLAIPSHHIMCVAAAQLQHEVLSSSLPPLSARTVGKHLPLQWLTNPLDFLARDRHPSPGSASTERAVVADTESSSFAQGTGARGKVLC